MLHYKINSYIKQSGYSGYVGMRHRIGPENLDRYIKRCIAKAKLQRAKNNNAFLWQLITQC